MIERLPLKLPMVLGYNPTSYYPTSYYYAPRLNPPDLRNQAKSYGWLTWWKFSRTDKIKYCLKHPKFTIKSLLGTALFMVGWKFKNNWVKVRKNSYVAVVNFAPNKFQRG